MARLFEFEHTVKSVQKDNFENETNKNCPVSQTYFVF